MHDEPLILYSADRKRRVLIERRPDGSFGWAEQYWFEHFHEGELIATGLAYRPTENSAFETMIIAVAEAKARFPWLR